jgi:hypothetical protein
MARRPAERRDVWNRSGGGEAVHATFCVMAQGGVTEDRSFDPPPAESRLWRYVDFPKYVSMLSTQTLWFSGPTRLSGERGFGAGSVKPTV